MRISFFLICTLIVGCTTNQYKTYYDNEHKKTKVEGHITKGVESGDWRYFDSLGTLIEFGEYQSGMRSGIWNYTFPEGKYAITWEKNQTTQGLVFNYPGDFKFSDSLSSNKKICFVKDSDKLIQIEYLENISRDSVLNSLKLKICSSYTITWNDCVEIQESNSTYNYYRMYVKGYHSEGFLYMLVADYNKHALVIQYFYPNSELAYHNAVFSGIIEHCYIDGHRIVNPIGSISSIIPEKLCQDDSI